MADVGVELDDIGHRAQCRDCRVHLDLVHRAGSDAVGQSRQDVLLRVASRRHLGMQVTVELVDLGTPGILYAQCVEAQCDETGDAAVRSESV